MTPMADDQADAGSGDGQLDDQKAAKGFASDISRLGVGHQRREHLEPAHPDERSALGGAFDAEPQQALAGEFGGGQGERHGVHTAHRVGPNAANRT